MFAWLVYVAYEVVLPVSLVDGYGYEPAAWGFLVRINPLLVTLFQLRLTGRGRGARAAGPPGRVHGRVRERTGDRDSRSRPLIGLQMRNSFGDDASWILFASIGVVAAALGGLALAGVRRRVGGGRSAVLKA